MKTKIYEEKGGRLVATIGTLIESRSSDLVLEAMLPLPQVRVGWPAG